jgi:hypothetical protein
MLNRLLLAGLALALCTACGLLPQRLETRAAQYYNFMAGQAPQTKYSSFLSPAYRGVFKREDLKALDKARGVASQASVRYPKATSQDVAVSFDPQHKHFAYSVVRPQLGDAFAMQPPVKWVRAGNRWYLYTGSDAEIKRYGPFPPQLGPPEPPKLPENAAAATERIPDAAAPASK